MIAENSLALRNRPVIRHWPWADPRGRLWLMKKTLTNNIALVALTLSSGMVTADQTAKTAAQLAVEQFNECADSLFKTNLSLQKSIMN